MKAADLFVRRPEQAFASNARVVIEVPVYYAENRKLTERLGKLICPIQGSSGGRKCGPDRCHSNGFEGLILTVI